MSTPSLSIRADLALDAARRLGATFLSETSGEEAALDSRILLEAASGLDRLAQMRAGDQAIGEAVASRFAALLARRRGGDPVWRILGTREFWGLPFAISPDVLDPRPDTETVVSAALDALADRRQAPLRVLDLGTGSGALLCALGHELPAAVGWGVDRSQAACRVAARNIAALGLERRLLVVNGDWAASLPASAFDLIVSNPPYIETDVIPTLDREVRDFDPAAALDGGPDGLACYRRITADLPRLLKPAGIAVLEIGSTQAGTVRDLLCAAGLTVQAVRRDLGGRDRVVVATNIAG